jgi:2-octaprenylphenol hydroxylase
MEMRADLLIVGAGMVGSALALALQDSGLEVLLLDGSPLSVKPSMPRRRSSRESAPCRRPASASSSALACGTASPGGAAAVSDMQVWDGSGTGQIHFSAASVHAEVLGHIVENRVVQDACWTACTTATSACWPTLAWSRCAAPAMTGC